MPIPPDLYAQNAGFLEEVRRRREEQEQRAQQLGFVAAANHYQGLDVRPNAGVNYVEPPAPGDPPGAPPGCTCRQCQLWRTEHGYAPLQTEQHTMTSDNRDLDWVNRESYRQRKRKMPLWKNEYFWRVNENRHCYHFVHVSEADPTLLCYTENKDKGERDIQTSIKPGRYLTRYFKNVLTAKEIAFYATWQVAGARPKSELSELELKFALTPDEIANVYDRGPLSCMDSRHYHNKDNPVRLYGAGDLAIAYLEGTPPMRSSVHNVLARCLVWPDKKVASRVYPTTAKWQPDGWPSPLASEDAHWALRDKLKEQGYLFPEEGGSFEGAKLLTRSKAGTYDFPYLDGGYKLKNASPYIVMWKP